MGHLLAQQAVQRGDGCCAARSARAAHGPVRPACAAGAPERLPLLRDNRERVCESRVRKRDARLVCAAGARQTA